MLPNLVTPLLPSDQNHSLIWKNSSFMALFSLLHVEQKWSSQSMNGKCWRAGILRGKTPIEVRCRNVHFDIIFTAPCRVEFSTNIFSRITIRAMFLFLMDSGHIQLTLKALDLLMTFLQCKIYTLYSVLSNWEISNKLRVTFHANSFHHDPREDRGLERLLSFWWNSLKTATQWPW